MTSSTQTPKDKTPAASITAPRDSQLEETLETANFETMETTAAAALGADGKEAFNED